jgi:trypsin
LTEARNPYVVQAAKKSGPAIVGITTQVFQKDIFNRTIYAGEGVGSGVLIDNEGHIVTNNHVVSGASNGEVTVSLSDGTTVKGTVMGTDEQSDLAVVKIDPPKNIQPVAIGDSDSLQVGEPAIAIGNPLGLEFKGSVTSGVISALARTIDDQGQRFPLIQTDAAINPGNSGGALLNADGELIGINSSKISKEGVEGMGFAIPINSAKPIIDSIIKNGKVIRPYLGVWAVDRQTAARNNVSYEGEGLLIVQLDSTGPVARAGIVEGDTIAQIDGKNVSTLIELKEQIDAKSPGDTILVSYTHNGKMKSAQVKLGQASTN